MKNKILIFILVFCLCFLCFVIPTFASDDVSVMSVTDLTGTTWSVPRDWTASAGYGDFSVDVQNNRTDIIWGGLYIGYAGASSAEANSIFFHASSGSGGSRISSTSSFTLTFSGGEDVTNPLLIQWLEENGTNITPVPPEPQTDIIEGNRIFMSYPPSTNFPPILVRPDPSFIPVGGSYVYEALGSYYLDNGLPYVFTHFAWELTSYTDTDNYTLEFQVQRESGVWVTLYIFVVQSGSQSIVFYPEIDYFMLQNDTEVDIDSWNLFYSHFAPQTDFESDDDDFTDNPWLYILEKVIEALKYPMWGYFSPWDIVTTISGIFIVTWLLKLIAGG